MTASESLDAASDAESGSRDELSVGVSASQPLVGGAAAFGGF